MKKQLSRILTLVLACALIGALPVCSLAETGAAEDTYLVGAYMPMTGTNGSYYQLLCNGQDIAIEEINANGGFNGQKVEIIRYDTMSSNEEAAKISQRMVEIDNVDAALPSPMSNEIKASADTLNKAHIPTIVVGTSPVLFDGTDWTYVHRAALNTTYAMPAYMGMITGFNYDSIAFIFSQEETCLQVANGISDKCKEGNVNIVSWQSVESTDADFTAPVADIINADPDIVFSAVSGAGQGVVTKLLRQMGYKGIIIQREIMTGDSIDQCGIEAAYYYAFPSLYITYEKAEDCDIEYMRSFLDRYEAKYGAVPNYDWAYRGYDEMMVLWAASKIAGTNDKEAINDAINKVVTNGLGGTLDFTNGYEGYEKFDSFIFGSDGKYHILTDWISDGSYEAFKAATGRDR